MAMIDQVEKILAGVTTDTLTVIARGVLDDQTAKLVGTPEWQSVGGLHGDRRTIGLRRLVGKASSGGTKREWSVVLKIIDMSVRTPKRSETVDPEAEINLYENGMFSGADVQFRSARCYKIDHLDEHRTLLWLEDLSGARQPPWSVRHYEETSFNLGTFHGKNLRENIDLPFPPGDSNFRSKWVSWKFPMAEKIMAENPDAPEFTQAFSGNRFELVQHYFHCLEPLWNRVETCPIVLSHGDCHARNMFPLNGSTVVIDWSGIGYRPIGSDLGMLIGSGLTWTHDERMRVGGAVSQFFDAYVEGLSAEGWVGDRDTVRLGMFSQLAGYVGVQCWYPANMVEDIGTVTRAGAEARMSLAWDAIPEATGQFLDLAEHLLHEVIELANGK